MAEPLTWGVLGTATIARKCLLPALQASAKARLRALGTRSPDTALKILQPYPNVRVTEGYEALIDDPDVEAIYIPLPNHLHLQWTLRALAAGKHVLCEKPLALNAAEAEAMAAAARDAGRFLMEGFMYRFHPRSRRIKQMVDEGKLGTLKSVRAAFCFAMPNQMLEVGEGFRLNQNTGGGALLDVGCYAVSTARWFFGREPVKVQAQADYHPNGVDLHIAGSLKFQGGGLAIIEASFVSALQQTYTLAGSRAVVELPQDAYIPWQKETQYTFRLADQEHGERFTLAGVDQYRLMIEHFADAVRGEARLAYGPDESIRNMRVLDTLATAAKTGETMQPGSS